MKRFVLVFVVASMFVGFASAEESRTQTPVEVGLFTPLQLPCPDCDVMGVGLDLLWGRHPNATGFQFGAIGCVVDGTMSGLQLGFFNYAKFLNGLQLGVVNVVEDGTSGIQVGLVNVMKDGRYPVVPVLNIGF